MKALTAFAQPLTMSSCEIAELTGKELFNVHRDIRNLLADLAAGDASVLNHVREEKNARGDTACFHLPKDLTLTLVAGYSAPLRHHIVSRWMELEMDSPKLPDFTNPAEAARAWALAYEEAEVQPRLLAE